MARQTMTGDVALSVRFFFGTKRKADLDNFNKRWQDALSGIDDLYGDYDKTRPRIEVTVR
jgi:hypothetical protein